MSGYEQAARVVQAADAVIASGDPADAAFELDRRDLARLLAAIGTAWGVAERRRTTTGERLRWSASCAIAKRIAERWENEAALAAHSAAMESSESANADGLTGTVIEFIRNRRSP